MGTEVVPYQVQVALDPLIEAANNHPAVVSTLAAAELDLVSIEEQVERAKIDSQEAYGLGGDLLKVLNSKKKGYDDFRKGLTKPLREVTAAINGWFDPVDTRFEAAKKKLDVKLVGWQRAERERLTRIEEERRRAAEAEALRQAELQQAIGDSKGAEQILESTIAAAAEPPKPVVTTVGRYTGARVSGQIQIRGEVKNHRAFLLWALSSLSDQDLARLVREFSQTELNRLAKQAHESKEQIPGFVIEERESTRAI